MWAGYGETKITPPMGVELCGYGYYLNRRAGGVMDDLFVRCTAIGTESAKCLIISADLIGLSDEVFQKINARIRERFAYMDDEILLVCTHTHTGPATNRLEGCGAPDEDYVLTLPALFERAVEAALGDKAEVEETFIAQNAIDPIGFNRTIPNGPVDNCVRGVLINRIKARPIALVSYACHPVTLGKESRVSADYPGEVCETFKSRGVDAVFLNGLCGDIDPVNNKICWGSGTRETLRDYAQRIFEGFYGGLKQIREMALHTARFWVDIPLEPADERAIDQISSKGSQAQVARAWKEEMLRRMPLPVSERAYVQVLRLNNLIFCAIPYEGYTQIGNLVREACPGYEIAVLGCSDGTKGYLPTKEEWTRKSYAAIDACFLYLRPLIQPGAAEILGRKVGEKLRKILN